MVRTELNSAFENIWKTLSLKENDTLNQTEIKLLVETAFHTGYEYGKKENTESDAKRYEWLKWYLKEKLSFTITSLDNKKFSILLHDAMWSEIAKSEISFDDLIDQLIKNVRNKMENQPIHAEPLVTGCGVTFRVTV